MQSGAEGFDERFTDFGVHVSVAPPPASQVDPFVGFGVQF